MTHAEVYPQSLAAAGTNNCAAGHAEHRSIWCERVGMWIWDADLYDDRAGWCPGDDEVSRVLSLTGEWESFNTAIFDSVLDDRHDGQVVVDVGAHIGWYTVRALRQGWPVVAIEGDPENYEMLNLNVLATGGIARTEYVWIDAEHRSALLDDLNQPIRFLKIDLEGNDDHAVAQLWPWFESHTVGYAIIEVSPAFTGLERAVRMVDRIAAAGYSVWSPPQDDAPPVATRFGEMTFVPRESIPSLLASTRQVDLLFTTEAVA